ncbi:MAG: hypothetical protein WBM08_15110 [Prochlorococcaceae cyanobacterium]
MTRLLLGKESGDGAWPFVDALGADPVGVDALGVDPVGGHA